MSIVSKEDVQSFVKEALGDEIADLREEIVKMSAEAQEKSETDRKYTHAFVGESARPEVEDNLKGNPEKGMKAARFIRLLAAGRGDPGRAALIAKEWGDGYMQKSLNESVFAAGGALVPQDFMNEVIELLRAKTVVRAMGATSIPMNMGSITMPFQDTASTANYIGELQNIPASQPSFGQLTLSAKKLVSLVPISNDLLRDSSINVDGLVRDDMVRSMSLREDIAFIRDNGAVNTPRGMRFWAIPGNVFVRTAAGGPGTATLNEITNDLFLAMTNLENLNVPLDNAGWIITPRTKSGLMRLRDGNGNFVYRDEMLRGTLLGFRYNSTTQIPTNLNVVGANNDTEVYFADFRSLVIAESTSLEVSVYEGGAFNDGVNVVSGISTDQTIIRTLARHDFGARQRGQEISVITGVDWGV
jgi:HK97 family phage major capsid protein